MKQPSLFDAPPQKAPKAKRTHPHPFGKKPKPKNNLRAGLAAMARNRGRGTFA